MARAAHQLPAGRHGLSRSFVVSNQRDRILAAVADTVYEKGYISLTVADILAASGVSRRTFYDLFPHKRAAFFAAYDASVQQAMAAAGAAFASTEHWPQQVRLAAHAFLGYLANDPPFTRIGIVELPLAGPEGMQRMLSARTGFEVFLAPGASLANHPIPPLLPKAIGSGIFAMIHSRVILSRTPQLPELIPACVYHCLAPYVGHEAAAREARSVTEGPLA